MPTQTKLNENPCQIKPTSMNTHCKSILNRWKIEVVSRMFAWKALGPPKAPKGRSSLRPGSRFPGWGYLFIFDSQRLLFLWISSGGPVQGAVRGAVQFRNGPRGEDFALFSSCWFLATFGTLFKSELYPGTTQQFEPVTFWPLEAATGAQQVVLEGFLKYASNFERVVNCFWLKFDLYV